MTYEKDSFGMLAIMLNLCLFVVLGRYHAATHVAYIRQNHVTLRCAWDREICRSYVRIYYAVHNTMMAKTIVLLFTICS